MYVQKSEFPLKYVLFLNVAVRLSSWCLSKCCRAWPICLSDLLRKCYYSVRNMEFRLLGGLFKYPSKTGHTGHGVRYESENYKSFSFIIWLFEESMMVHHSSSSFLLCYFRVWFLNFPSFFFFFFFFLLAPWLSVKVFSFLSGQLIVWCVCGHHWSFCSLSVNFVWGKVLFKFTFFFFQSAMKTFCDLWYLQQFWQQILDVAVPFNKIITCLFFFFFFFFFCNQWKKHFISICLRSFMSSLLCSACDALVVVLGKMSSVLLWCVCAVFVLAVLQTCTENHLCRRDLLHDISAVFVSRCCLLPDIVWNRTLHTHHCAVDWVFCFCCVLFCLSLLSIFHTHCCAAQVRSLCSCLLPSLLRCVQLFAHSFVTLHTLTLTACHSFLSTLAGRSARHEAMLCILLSLLSAAAVLKVGDLIACSLFIHSWIKIKFSLRAFTFSFLYFFKLFLFFIL